MNFDVVTKSIVAASLLIIQSQTASATIYFHGTSASHAATFDMRVPGDDVAQIACKTAPDRSGIEAAATAIDLAAGGQTRSVAGAAGTNAILQDRLRGFSNESRKKNIDTRACGKPLKVTKASCYGRGDAFADGKHRTYNGLIYKPEYAMTAAYPDVSMMSAIIVVKNPKNNIAREVVITDKGPSRTMQTVKGRGIDLSPVAMDSLGVHCPSVMEVEIYNCAVRD